MKIPRSCHLKVCTGVCILGITGFCCRNCANLNLCASCSLNLCNTAILINSLILIPSFVPRFSSLEQWHCTYAFSMFQEAHQIMCIKKWRFDTFHFSVTRALLTADSEQTAHSWWLFWLYQQNRYILVQVDSSDIIPGPIIWTVPSYTTHPTDWDD